MGLDSLWMILATAVLDLAMVAYHRAMSSGLGNGYAELSALTALANVLGVFTIGASTTLVKIFAEDDAERGPAAAKGRMYMLLMPIFKAMAVCSLVLALLAPVVVSYLKLGGVLSYALVGALFVFNLGILAARATVQGTQHFGVLGLSLASEGLGRLGFAILFVAGGLGVAGALGASIVGQFIGLSFCVVAIRKMGKAVAPPPRHLPRSLKELASDVAVLGLFSVICFLDIFVVKHRLDDSAAANYSRAALVAKSFLYLASALNMVLLPAVSMALARGSVGDAKKILLKMLAGALTMELFGLAFVWRFTPWVIVLLCGSKPEFQDLVPLIRFFSLALVPLALAQLVIYYLLAARDYRALLWLMVATTLGYVIRLQFCGGDLYQVVGSLAAVALILLVGTLLLALLPRKSQLRAAT